MVLAVSPTPMKAAVYGKPLTELSTKVIKQLAICLKGQIPIIGVGGINSAEDAFG